MIFLHWFGSIGGVVIVFTFIGFLVRRLAQNWIDQSVKYRYDRAIETLRADLKRDYDVQIEKLRAALAQNHFRFSHVFEHTSDTIVETYRKIQSVNQAVEEYMQSFDPEKPESRKRLLDRYEERVNEFLVFYRQNKLYIPRPTIKKIEHAFHQIWLLARTFNRSERLQQAVGTIAQARAEVVADTEKRLEQLHEAVPKLLESLEDDFQRILGFQYENETAFPTES